MSSTSDKNHEEWQIESVELETEDESGGWFVVHNFEWQIINAQTLEIVLRIPYRHVIDNTEYPERDYWVGPRKTVIVGNEVRAYLVQSDRTGFRFENQEDQPSGYDVYPLPRRE